FIIDKGWQEGWVVPQLPSRRTGNRVAVVGSGPAGMACAQQLARAGHDVVLFEKSDRIGGLLRYGIPDFKMSKHHIDRRVEQMRAEGVEFRVSQHVGGDAASGISALAVVNQFDAVVLSAGSEHPRDLDVPGGKVEALIATRVESIDGKLSPVAGSDFEIKADLVLLAMGYVHPVHQGMLDELGVKYDARGNVNADTESYRTSLAKVFAAGDTRRGQSLVVWAIREGRQCARSVDEFLMGASDLPR